MERVKRWGVGKALDKLRTLTDYYYEYSVANDTVYIKTENGIPVKDWIYIRRYLNMYVSNIVVHTRGRINYYEY